MQKEKVEFVFMIERTSTSHERGGIAKFLSPVEADIHEEWNPLCTKKSLRTCTGWMSGYCVQQLTYFLSLSIHNTLLTLDSIPWKPRHNIPSLPGLTFSKSEKGKGARHQHRGERNLGDLLTRSKTERCLCLSHVERWYLYNFGRPTVGLGI